MILSKPKNKFTTFVFGIIFLVAVALMLFSSSSAGTLSCTVGTSCANTAVFKMNATSNAHAGLATSTYTQIVCCGGVTGLGTNCSGTFGVVGRLSADTNAHFEYGTSTTPIYDANKICLSAGTSVNIGYQVGNCNGYDTTIASMTSSTIGTNAHVGDANAYSNKICGSAAAAAVISVSVSDGIINYGILAHSASSSTLSNDTQTLTNDGDGAENFNIKGQNTSCPWTLAGSIGTDQYHLERSTTTGATWGDITTSYTTIQYNIAASGTAALDLRLTMPTDTNCTSTQNADIVVQAVSYP